MPAVPQLLDGKVWQGLEHDKRVAYDDDRIAHHSRLLIAQTPAVREVVTTGRRLAHLNRSAHFGRCGLIVCGPARTGKTTATHTSAPGRWLPPAHAGWAGFRPWWVLSVPSST
jgi:hypothetical protein